MVWSPGLSIKIMEALHLIPLKKKGGLQLTSKIVDINFLALCPRLAIYPKSNH